MKRLSFLLILGVFLGLLAVPASAAGVQFSDADAIRHVNEVEMMVDIGVINGYEDGTFRPDNNLRRSEAAKLMAILCQEKLSPAAGSGFYDTVNSWVEPYVTACVQRGIIAGYGDGSFRPNDYVTGRELAKMLLIAVGYSRDGYQGVNWSAAVDADANKLKLYEGMTEDPAAFCSRQNACLLAYHAMQSFAVSGKNADGTPVYRVDELLNPVTYLEHRFRTVKFSGVLTGNEYADLTNAGKRLKPGLTKIAEHAPFQVSTELSMVGRTVNLYTVRHTVGNQTTYTVIGNPTYETSEACYYAASKLELAAILSLTSIETDSQTEYYYNYERSTQSRMGLLGDNVSAMIVDRENDGWIDAIFVTEYTPATVISTAPLAIQYGAVITKAVLQTRQAEFEEGDQVQCVSIGGVYYIK